MPVDEAHADESFAEFRVRLQRALREKDADHVLSIVGPDIKLSFGDSYGIEDFKKSWLTPGMTTNGSDIWTELGEVLALGGTFQTHGDERVFIAPYVFDRFPDAYDSFEYAAVITEKAPLRETPTSDAPAIAELSYDIVRVLDERPGGTSEWMEVQAVAGSRGFLRATHVRSPIDYRAFFEKHDGQWKMTIFLAGD